MSIRYSDYTVEQLRDELGKLKEESLKAEQVGEVNKVAIIERKMQIVASYMINPDQFEEHTVYELNGDPGYTFHVNYINGVMAWGHRINLLGEMRKVEEALPISMLGDKQA
ncbi:MAG TPA: YfhH family protein [Pseudogracilibacillus sp.]|nr:YfhH family protein [Pseudogracilibacillus sp.]